MDSRHVIGAVALAAALSFVATRAVYSQDDSHVGPTGKMSDEEMWKMIQERSATTEEHSKLSNLAGTWDASVRCSKDGVEKTSKGSLTSESALGGRVLLSRFKGEMNGHPFEGIELQGYDKEKRQHWTIWTDSFGTGYMTMLGTRESDGSIAQKTDEYECNGMKITSSTTTRVVDPDHVTFVMVNKSPGVPDDTMTINYTRRK